MSWLDTVHRAIIEDWIGVSVGIIGIAVAIYIYFSTRHRKILAFRYTGERLLGLQDGGLPAEITVQYQGNEIPRLTRSLVVVWNAGEVTIANDDLVENDPLRVVLPEDGEVLSVAIVKVTRDVINFRTRPKMDSPHEVEVSLDFLDSNDGTVIEVLHTSEVREVGIRGTVIGIPTGIRNIGVMRGRRRRERVSQSKAIRIYDKVLFVVFPILMGGSLVLMILLTWLGILTPRPDAVPGDNFVAAFVAGVLLIVMGISVLWQDRRRYPAALHADELD